MVRQLHADGVGYDISFFLFLFVLLTKKENSPNFELRLILITCMPMW